MDRQGSGAEQRWAAGQTIRGALASGLVLCDTGIDERLVRGARPGGAARGWAGPALLLLAALAAGAGLRAWLAPVPDNLAAAPPAGGR
jgi:hypothetical protein